MGTYLNPGNNDFVRAVNSKIYVDKTEMLKYTNSILNTEQQFICVSRPRRFGKSMAANMLVAYYSRGCDSRELFSRFKIGKADSFEKHLNQYNVRSSHSVRSTRCRLKKPSDGMTAIRSRVFQFTIRALLSCP